MQQMNERGDIERQPEINRAMHVLTWVLAGLLGVTLLVAWFTGPSRYTLIAGGALMGYSALLFLFDLAARS